LARVARRSSSSRSARSLLRSRDCIELCDICQILRASRRQLVRTELGEPDDRHLSHPRGDDSSPFPDRAERHAADAGQYIDPDWFHTQRQNPIRLSQATPGSARRNESKFHQSITEPACVGFAGIDEQVEVLRVSYVAVNADGEAAHHHEPDAMALQQA
jgi:hypothetical protein